MKILIIAALVCTPYFVNIVKGMNCQESKNLRCDTVHALGIAIPPASYITVWVSDYSD